MAIFDARATASQDSGTSITFAHTVGTDLGRLLVVALHYRAHNTPAAHATGVTWNGVAMVFIRRDQATDRTSELWLMWDPASGTHNVVATMSADPENMVAGAASYSAMDSSRGILDQSGVTDENALGAGFPDVEAVTMSTHSPVDLIIAALANYPNGHANDPTIVYGTQRYNVDSPVPNIAGTLADSIGTVGPTEIRWTSPQQFSWAISAVVFAGSAAERYRLEVDWNNDGDFSDADEDISAYAVTAHTKRGREWDSNLFGRSIAGALTAELDNSDGKFSSFNTASPLTGEIRPALMVRLSMVAPFAGVLWTGFLSSLQPHTGGIPTATLEAQGPFALLGSKANKISPLPLDNQLTGAVVNKILDAARWPRQVAEFLLNGGFEAGGAPGTNWTDTTSNLTGAWTYNADRTEGAQSLQLVITAASSTGNKLAYQFINVDVFAGKGGTLKFDFDYKLVTYAGTTLKTWVVVGYNNIDGVQIGSFNVLLTSTVTAAWTPVSQLLTIPEGCVSVQVFAGITLLSGAFDSAMTVRFDNFRISWPAGHGSRLVYAGEVPVGRWAIESKVALEALQEMEETEVGFLYEGLNWDVVFEGRFTRIVNSPTAVANISDAVGEILQYEDVEQNEPLDDIFNIISALVLPGHAGTLAVLWTQREVPITLAAGASVTYRATMPSGNLYVSPWVTPVVGTDVTQTGVANSDISIIAVHAAKHMDVTIKNNHATTAASLTLIRARGTPFVADEPIGIASRDATSVDRYGPREFPLPSPYYYNTVYAQAALDYFISQFKDPRPVMKVALPSGHIPQLMQQAVLRKVSDRVNFSALGPRTMLGVARDFYIESIEHEITVGEPMRTVWYISPAGSSTYWVLGSSVLGTSTILAW